MALAVVSAINGGAARCDARTQIAPKGARMPVQLTCCSHSPLMQKSEIEATDASAQEAFFAGVESAGERLRAFDPELIVAFYPDHYIGFFLDLMPAFCVGLGAHTAVEFGIEEAELRIPSQLGLDLVRRLQSEGFDPAFSHKMVVDHGMSLPLIQLAGSVDRYEVLPIFVNCAGDPRPSFSRVRAFGDAVGRFVGGSDRRIAVIGSGGLSHDSPTSRIMKVTPERFLRENRRDAEQQKAFEAHGVENARKVVAGSADASMQPNETWDRAFLDKFLAFEWDALDSITDAELDEQAGGGTHEVRSWVAAAAAANAIGRIESELLYYRVIPEWITGMAVVAAEQA
jgi:2,3-dihydroxyphenylpropionate 1,2-dioxygenase